MLIRQTLYRFIAAVIVLSTMTFMSHADDDAVGKKYEANWESLNSRPIPDWWLDAKFGIFIHWGLYSVPAYAPVGSYAEWYGESMNPEPSSEYIGIHHKELREKTRNWHVENFSASFDYKDFAPLWKAELYEPDLWATIFKDAGAGYVMMTSKHHDGFTLWPSAEANKSWGHPWNSVDVGPKRDVLGDLMTSVRAKGMKAGFYYSLYEWYNPTYTNDKKDRAKIDSFVENHFIPQFKDAVSRYQPAIVWGDGSWDHPSSTWRTPELLAWMYNTQPNGKTVVVNDRWGDEMRLKTGFYTSEYGAGLDAGSHPWEESRGMAYSYGLNRMESAADYATGNELVMMLVDVVSRGGNFSLDVGPSADGRIPPIQEDRLRHIGKWLRSYGEGIKGSRTFKDGVQWSKGILPEISDKKFKADYDINRYTVSPKPGEARKELFYTRKNDTVYAFATKTPEKKLRINDVRLRKDSNVYLIGIDAAKDEKLKWKKSGKDIVITVPHFDTERIKIGAPYGFKITKVQNVQK